jgi:hypothetical protein
VELFNWTDGIWIETVRWVKYEECTEGADNHWGRPHVGLVGLDALKCLRLAISNGISLFNLSATHYSQIVEEIAENAYIQFDLDPVRIIAILQSLMSQSKCVLPSIIPHA